MNLIYTNENPLLVHSAKNILDMKGIESFYKNEHGNTMGPEFGTSNFLELWIANKKDYNLARELIDSEIENPPLQEPWLCSECNEENEGSFDLCWKCQSNKLID